jgi:hypothetical protein
MRAVAGAIGWAVWLGAAPPRTVPTLRRSPRSEPALAAPMLGCGMAFEVEPVAVRKGRPWLPVAAVAIAASAILGVALMTAGSAAPAPAPDLAATSRPTVVAAAVGSPAPSHDVTVARRDAPLLRACGTVAGFECGLAVRAALDVLPADVPAVREADVAAGIICGDTLDCPPSRVDGLADPLASVTLRFVDGGPSAWVNVVYRQHGRPFDFQPVIDAWIVRWIH